MAPSLLSLHWMARLRQAQQGALRYHPECQPGQARTAAEGGADRRSAKNAAAPINQSREAHHSARPHHSPKGGQSAAVFAADWPHEGALPALIPLPAGEGVRQWRA